MPILISGIGRSGTTTLYQILGKGFLNKYKDARCVYEPYLWHVPQVENTANINEQRFSTNEIGLFNVNVHCKTPLFLSGCHRLHDQWLRNVFGPVSYSSDLLPENRMAKVIRGAGRLDSALSRYKNLKVVIVTRNVIDTVNSGLGLFSFFGDEFHPSDKKRFIQEVNEKFNANLKYDSIKDELEWSVLWWRYFTLASLNTLEAFPGRVMLVPYESYITNKKKYMEEIFEFSGIDRNFIDHSLFEQGAGPSTSISYLSGKDVENLKQEMNWYFDQLNSHGKFNFNAKEYFETLRTKYSKRPYKKSLLLITPTNLTAVQWRIRENNKVNNYFDRGDSLQKVSPLNLTTAIAEFGGNSEILCKSRMQIGFKKNSEISVGVLITCFNNASTIANAIFSVLAQTRMPELIYIADDCSSDDSLKIINSIAKKYKQIQVVQRRGNIGVAANRDLAIRAMNTDYITTLDGDDLFYPEKIELEVNALENSKTKVAFSDIVVFDNNGGCRQRTDPYSNKSKRELLAMLSSRSVPVPRDMMFSKELFIKAQGFDVGMNLYEDWSLKMRLINVASEKGWVHSGGVGTVYDRRIPGLSGENSINHAYGQLSALARNVHIFKDYPDLVIDGLKTVSKHLDGDLFKDMEIFINRSSSNKIPEEVVYRLEQFWKNVSFKNDHDYKYKQIKEFTNIP